MILPDYLNAYPWKRPKLKEERLLVRSLSGILTIYSWGGIVITLLFLFLIARFYEKKSGQKSYYQFFLLPLVLFLLSAIRYLFSTDEFVGDVTGDTLLFSAGLVLGFLSYSLLNLMTGGRN